MATSGASSITPRNNSPRSNLTSALQEAGNQMPYLQHSDLIYGHGQPSEIPRNDSISNMFGSYYGNGGAKPISMRERQRRESNNAGSFMGGMSWGASSINGGDWVRDDVLMAGTSPAAFPSAFQQPSSFQSSSYLPKMEASFFKDYWCCNICHASLHDLMQHMEECHGAQSANILTPQPVAGQTGMSFPRQPALSTPQPMHKAAPVGQTSQPSNAQVTKGFQPNGNQAKSILATIHDDPLDSMDFDEPNSSIANMALPNTSIGQQPFRSPNAPAQASSQPFSLLSSNPTVSSVNTPTLSTHTISQAKNTPDSSIPSTPHAVTMNNFDTSLDMYSGLGDVAGMPMMDGFDYNNLNFALPTDLGGLTIHDPAKQLTSKNGNMDNAQMQFAFNNGQYALNDEDMNRALNQQNFPGGIPSSALGFPGHEEKKYKCPVIGCEKAYKNQNGLKYHKQHGHTNQKLKQNPDGSFSIVDPLTSVPYPGTVGMEKEKPYRCEKCGKRYKNLNGLKYHRQHSPPCNPELQQQMVNTMPGLISLQQIQQNASTGIL